MKVVVTILIWKFKWWIGSMKFWGSMSKLRQREKSSYENLDAISLFMSKNTKFEISISKEKILY